MAISNCVKRFSDFLSHFLLVSNFSIHLVIRLVLKCYFHCNDNLIEFLAGYTLYSYLYGAQYFSMIYFHAFLWLASLKCHLKENYVTYIFAHYIKYYHILS